VAEPLVLRTLEELRGWRVMAGPVHFVPTMGNLHRGHLALVEKAAGSRAQALVSIFVNPTQFAPGEDFDEYPRTLDDDLAALAETDCAAVWLPDVDTMYPLAADQRYAVQPPSELAAQLCGAYRPGHFDGVCNVVLRLLWQAMPQRLILGEKDYQQLLILRRMVRDFSIPVDVHGVATVREDDGLALSSRNRYLSPDQRARAPELYRTLRETAECAAEADPGTFAALERSSMERLAVAGFSPEYVSIRSELDLGPPNGRNDRIFAAARLGSARLIDNVAVKRQICR